MATSVAILTTSHGRARALLTGVAGRLGTAHCAIRLGVAGTLSLEEFRDALLWPPGTSSHRGSEQADCRDRIELLQHVSDLRYAALRHINDIAGFKLIVGLAFFDEVLQV